MSSHGIYRHIGFGILGASLLLASAESQTSRITQPGTVSATTPSSPRIPAGITFTVRLVHSLDSQTATAGQGWEGILVDDIVNPGGKVYALSGGTVAGVVASVQAATDTTPASISLRAVSLNGVELQTESLTKTKDAGGSGDTISTPSGRVSLPAGFSSGTTSGSSTGFATTTAPGSQAKLASGAIVTFSTTAP
jgi:hypothetical protein